MCTCVGVVGGGGGGGRGGREFSTANKFQNKSKSMPAFTCVLLPVCLLLFPDDFCYLCVKKPTPAAAFLTPPPPYPPPPEPFPAQGGAGAVSVQASTHRPLVVCVTWLGAFPHGTFRCV